MKEHNEEQTKNCNKLPEKSANDLLKMASPNIASVLE